MKYFTVAADDNKPLIFTVLYFLLISFIVLSRLFNSLEWLNQLCKPLLMPTLAIFFTISSKKYSKYFYGVLMALFFSWLGDVFLIFEKQHELFFIAGLSAFLLAHLFYIFVFKLDVMRFNLLKSKPYLPFLLLLYLVGFLYLLQPNLNELFLPVSIYALIICIMLLFAILRYGQVDPFSFKLSCFGALLFVLSDSVIAINKFLFPFEWAYTLIIVLYALGQFFIVKGLLVTEAKL